MPFTSRYHAVVAMASETIDNAKSVAFTKLGVLTLKTKSNARRGEVVFDASMSALAIMRQARHLYGPINMIHLNLYGELFGAQRLHRIHRGCVPRRQIAGEHRYHAQHNRDRPQK